jgi:peptidoglycan/LPS O-acetylase OafA/YrhL
VLPLLVVLSALIHRPAHDNLATLHQAAYFLSAYVAGMWASHSRARLEPMLQKHWLPLTLGLGAMIIAQWRWSPFHGNYQGRGPFSFEHGLIDWTVLQKLLMCFVLLGFTARWYTRRVRGVDLLAELSFPIFFIHAYVLFLFGWAFKPGKPEGSLALYVVTTAGLFLACVLVTWTLRAALGRNSRWVIGA